MSFFRILLCLSIFMAAPGLQSSRLPEIGPKDVTAKVHEIMRAHVEHKKMTPLIMRRTVERFLAELDPSKTYFIRDDIADWLDLDDKKVDTLVAQFEESNFTAFQSLFDRMQTAIQRRDTFEKELATAELPKDVHAKEFKDLEWCTSVEALRDRLLRIRALQKEAVENLEADQRELAIKRIEKRREGIEADIIEPDTTKRQEYMLSLILKAIAGALDTHTAYFTPGEASQFMISVQQRLFGIGAQLRDDLNGLTVVRIIEGGPAERSGELKVKDRIIAVDAVPVVGMDITDAVELIRGDEGKAVRLTIIRDVGTEGKHQDEKMDVTVTRGEVVLNETRLESHVEPFADGVIAYLHLFSFYQDPESSSALDITRALHKIQEEHKIKGVVLDLRFNSGGMLSQAVAVTGLFITRGVVVSIKDDSGRVQHLRDLDGNVIFGGPMIVVANRASASAAEIVTQTLQDYGRAIVVGDDHTFGKGTFQTFTLNSQREENVNPQGEYKVTRGTYYTVSGKSPQKKGVPSDILVPGPLAKADIGEQFSDYALEGGAIAPLFDDELLDIPEAQRQRVAQLYRVNLQPILQRYTKFLPTLRSNAETRIAANKAYQSFLEKIGKEEVEKEDLEQFEGVDFQLTEAYNILKDLIVLTNGE